MVVQILSGVTFIFFPLVSYHTMTRAVPKAYAAFWFFSFGLFFSSFILISLVFAKEE